MEKDTLAISFILITLSVNDPGSKGIPNTNKLKLQIFARIIFGIEAPLLIYQDANVLMFFT